MVIANPERRKTPWRLLSAIVKAICQTAIGVGVEKIRDPEPGITEERLAAILSNTPAERWQSSKFAKAAA